MLVDVAASHAILTFIDRYSGYNQIYVVEEGTHKTAFRFLVALSISEWVVMPFGLKN